MPKPKNPNPAHDKLVKKERSEKLSDIQAFLEKKGIKSEKVLDFICFEYKGQDHRVRYLSDAKIAMGLESY